MSQYQKLSNILPHTISIVLFPQHHKWTRIRKIGHINPRCQHFPPQNHWTNSTIYCKPKHLPFLSSSFSELPASFPVLLGLPQGFTPSNSSFIFTQERLSWLSKTRHCVCVCVCMCVCACNSSHWTVWNNLELKVFLTKHTRQLAVLKCLMEAVESITNDAYSSFQPDVALNTMHSPFEDWQCLHVKCDYFWDASAILTGCPSTSGSMMKRSECWTCNE